MQNKFLWIQWTQCKWGQSEKQFIDVVKWICQPLFDNGAMNYVICFHSYGRWMIHLLEFDILIYDLGFYVISYASFNIIKLYFVDI